MLRVPQPPSLESKSKLWKKGSKNRGIGVTLRLLHSETLRLPLVYLTAR
jgi:hypothetical protein